MSRAIEWALNSNNDLPNFLSLNIGSNDWNFTIKDLAMSVREIMPSVEVSINENADPDRRSYKVDFSKFKQLAPEYYPVETISNTILKLKNGIEKMQFRNENFRESHYIRLNTINYLINNKLIN
jgi:nucleoside-diphosphate-sugar epimerase